MHVRCPPVVTYRLSKWDETPIKRTFYEPDVQKVQLSDNSLFRVNKVLKRKGWNVLVRWKGWPSKYDSWIPAQHHGPTKTKRSRRKLQWWEKLASLTKEQWAYANAFHQAEERAWQRKQCQWTSHRLAVQKKKPRRQKTCLTLKELARAFPDIAQQVCFRPKQLTYKSLVSPFPASKHIVAQWL